MDDRTLVSLSRKVTIVLSVVAFAIGFGLLLIDRDKQVFWVIIFGWSGIAATFCPTMILSLFWTKLTAMGAKCSMVAGFLGVPLFSFVVPQLLRSSGMETAADYLVSLDVLLPSFAIGFVVAIVVSLADRRGQERVAGALDDLRPLDQP